MQKGNVKTRKIEPLKFFQYKLFQIQLSPEELIESLATFFAEFGPLENTINVDLCFPDILLYNGPLPIKMAKYQDVMKLAWNPADMEFYEKLYHGLGSAGDVNEHSSEDYEKKLK